MKSKTELLIPKLVLTFFLLGYSPTAVEENPGIRKKQTIKDVHQ